MITYVISYGFITIIKPKTFHFPSKNKMQVKESEEVTYDKFEDDAD